MIFTMKQLLKANPCPAGLNRLTQALGEYTDGTPVTLEHATHVPTGDILWALRLMPLTEHEQKVVSVRTALYAARLVLPHATNDHALECIEAAELWLENPCDETRDAANAAHAANARIKAYLLEMLHEYF